jgi:hypothetical protein
VNNAEYKTIRDKLARTFPALRQWFDSLDEIGQAGLRERWGLILLPLEKIAIEDAIGELAKAVDDPWPFDRDKERAAAIVADKSRAIALDRERAKRSAVLSTPESPTPRKVRQSHANERTDTITANIGALIEADTRHDAECVSHRKAKGRCRPGCEVPRLIAREYCERTEHLHEYGAEPRYKCHLCRDTGAVSIVSPEVVAEYASAGRITHPQTSAVRCTCAAGEFRKWLARLDDRQHVRLDLYDEAGTVAKCQRLANGGGRREAAFDKFNETVGAGF